MMHNTLNILVVDDEQDYCDVMEMILTGEGYGVKTCNDGYEALKMLEAYNFHVVLTDLMMPKMSGNELLAEIKHKYSNVEVIMMTAYGTIEKAVDAMRQGAYTYVTKGENPEQLLVEIRRLCEVQRLKTENKKLRAKINMPDYLLDSKNARFKEIIEVAKKAAQSNVNVLILGESGVGKEVLARFIHQNSERCNENFVDINCHAIPEPILESELFGHEKGAFTGANYKRIGRFEDADKGSLFLDEIGDIPLSTQAKLLKVLENKKLYPVGSNTAVKVDFRLITATNKELKSEIASEKFREDLFYRLSTIVIEIPPIRERREDLPDFIEYFLRKSELEMKKPIEEIEIEVMNYLLEYDYPGNIRELKNIIERLLVLADEGIIRSEHLPHYGQIKKKVKAQADLKEEVHYHEGDIRTLREVRKDVECKYIVEIIKREKGDLNKVSECLGITRRQLSNKLIEYNINKNEPFF